MSIHARMFVMAPPLALQCARPRGTLLSAAVTKPRMPMHRSHLERGLFVLSPLSHRRPGLLCDSSPRQASQAVGADCTNRALPPGFSSDTEMTAPGTVRSSRKPAPLPALSSTEVINESENKGFYQPRESKPMQFLTLWRAEGGKWQTQY